MATDQTILDKLYARFDAENPEVLDDDYQDKFDDWLATQDLTGRERLALGI